MRASSGTCMKRFSKIVSVMHALPARARISTMNCACMSVGKPGYGWVVMSTGCELAAAAHAHAAAPRR